MGTHASIRGGWVELLLVLKMGSVVLGEKKIKGREK